MIGQLILSSEVEREAGMPIEAVRKWRTRYGWPVPVTVGDKTGYTRDQINQLRLIQRLLDAGFRPAQVVGRPETELIRFLNAVVAAIEPDQWTSFTKQSINLVASYDVEGLEDYLSARLDTVGLGSFVRDHVAPLLVAIGEAWARGDIGVHQEHLASSLLTQMLQARIHGPGRHRRNSKRILLATPPEEFHAIGLYMVQAVLADQGISTMMLGASVPAIEIPLAVEKCRASILGLSFSFSYPGRKVRPLLEDLRAKIDPAVEIWVGGAGLRAVTEQAIEGVRIFSDLNIPYAELIE